MTQLSVENAECKVKSRLEETIAIEKISEVKYKGLLALQKPSPKSRGVYGGNLCAQALIVAMETVEDKFTPHSMHSYFVKAGDDSIPCDYDVEKTSDGKNFANRLVRVSQKGNLCYIVIVSLTKRNSIAAMGKEFKMDPTKQSPFEFQKPVPSAFYRHNIEDLPTIENTLSHLQYKFPPEFADPSLSPEESKKRAAERELTFWTRIDDTSKSQAAKYAGFAIMSDSIYLSGLSRILHLTSPKAGPSGGIGSHFFSVSLDHSIYFHDDSFDPTKWTLVNFKAPRFSNNRVLMEASYFDENGKLYATIVQEGLVFFRDSNEFKAKL